MSDLELKTLVGDWAILEGEEEEKKIMKVSHWCGGVGEEVNEIGSSKWFHPTDGWNETPSCMACKTSVPDGVIMMVKLNNIELLGG